MNINTTTWLTPDWVECRIFVQNNFLRWAYGKTADVTTPKHVFLILWLCINWGSVCIFHEAKYLWLHRGACGKTKHFDVRVSADRVVHQSWWVYKTHFSFVSSSLIRDISTRSLRFSCSKKAALIAISSSLARLWSLDLLAASLFFLLLSQYNSSCKSKAPKTY